MVGVVVLIILSVTQMVRYSKEDSKDILITKEDAGILTEALYPNITSTILYREWMKNKEEAMQWEQLKQLLDYLEEESGGEKKQNSLYDVVTFPEDFFQHKAKEKVTTKDWYQIFNLLCSFYDPEKSIVEDTIRVLGMGEQVKAVTGETLGKQELLSAAGYRYQYENTGFTDSTYQTLKVMRKGSELLAIKQRDSVPIQLSNTWIMQVLPDRVHICVANYDVSLKKKDTVILEAEQIADLTLTEGVIDSSQIKTERYHGKLMQVSKESMEIEGHGTIPLAPDVKVYRLFGTLEQSKVSDLIIGYDFTDYVIEDGKICAALITRDGAMENIRVLLCKEGFAGRYHESVSVSVDTAYDVVSPEVTQTYQAGEAITLDNMEEKYKSKRIRIVPKALTSKITILSLARQTGVPAYRGTLEIEKTDAGFVLINELLLEEYLYAVIPSEMPSFYPQEALKSQAICARTYAYQHMLHAGLGEFGAHVDDSTAYQVYHNIEESMESTTAAKETKGQVMFYGEEPIGAYYYSTSCGYGSDAGIWHHNRPEDYPYLQSLHIASKEGEYEQEEPWYRWQYTQEDASQELIRQRLQDRYAVNQNLILTRQKNGLYESQDIPLLGDIQNIEITKRLDGGAVDELTITGTLATVKVGSEYNVRYVLSDHKTKVIRQDGSESGPSALLPSAFLTIEPTLYKQEVVGYSIKGGGYGHGVGMSQNAAKVMADTGLTEEQILYFFYPGIRIQTIY